MIPVGVIPLGRRVLARSLFVLCFLALPLAHALTLDEALQAAENRPAVSAARIELRDAVINLERVQGDPLAVRNDILQAEQRLALARSSFEQTYYSALGEIASAYTNVLQGLKGVQVAQKGVAVNETSLNIAQIRLDNGSGTQLDLDEARTTLNETQNSLRSSRDNLNVAVNNLESILNRELQAESLEPIPDDYLVQVPELQTVLDAAEEHPTVVQAEQQLELAQLNTELLDPSYASRSQLEGADTGLTNARESVQETKRGFRIQARNLYNSTESAQEAYQTEQEALSNTNERLQTQRQRFEGGLIARIELSQSELSNLQAELEALQARYGYLTSLLELQSGTLVDLSGPEVLDTPSVQAIEASAAFGAARGETGSAPTSSPSESGSGSEQGQGSAEGTGSTGTGNTGTSNTGNTGTNNTDTSGTGASGTATGSDENTQSETTESSGTTGETGDETTGGSQGGNP